MKRNILLVCTGNICRSPMAAALLADRAARAGETPLYCVSSAGTWALDGEPASPEAAAVMQRRGLSLAAHRGRTINRQMLDAADLVLVMTAHHRDSIAAEFPEARDKLHLFSELAGQQYDIADPYGGPIQEYEACALGLAQIIETGYARLAELAASPSGQDRQ